MARGTKVASSKSRHGARPFLQQPVPAARVAGAGWGQACSALQLLLRRGRELSAVKGPEWAACEVAGYG